MEQLEIGVQQEEADIETLAALEGTRISSALAIYEQTHPRPQKEVQSFIKWIGLEAIILTLSAVSSIVISAIRVGVMLLISEVRLGDLYLQAAEIAPWTKTLLEGVTSLMLFLAMFTFEGFLFFAGLKRGRKDETIDAARIGVITAFVVTIAAGLLSSMSISSMKGVFIDNARLIIEGITIAGTGLGAPILSYYGARNLGVLRREYGQYVIEVGEEYNRNVADWLRKFNTHYQKSGARKLGDTSEPVKHVKKSDQEGLRVQEKVDEWLKVNGLTANDIGPKNKGGVFTPLQVAQALGLDDSNGVRPALNRLRAMQNNTKGEIQ